MWRTEFVLLLLLLALLPLFFVLPLPSRLIPGISLPRTPSSPQTLGSEERMKVLEVEEDHGEEGAAAERPRGGYVRAAKEVLLGL